MGGGAQRLKTFRISSRSRSFPMLGCGLFCESASLNPSLSIAYGVLVAGWLSSTHRSCRIGNSLLVFPWCIERDTYRIRNPPLHFLLWLHMHLVAYYYCCCCCSAANFLELVICNSNSTSTTASTKVELQFVRYCWE